MPIDSRRNRVEAPFLNPNRDSGHRVSERVDADREKGDERRRGDHGPGVGSQADTVLADHQAPVGRRRRLAEAKERQPGHDHYRVREAEARLDRERRDKVGQDFADHDPPGRHAFEFDGLDKVPLGDFECGGPHHSRHLRCVGKAHSQHDEPQFWANDRYQQQNEHELRKGEDHVDGAHDEAVRAAAQVSGCDACRRAHDDADDSRAQRHDPQRRSPRPPCEHPGDGASRSVWPPATRRCEGLENGTVVKAVEQSGAARGPITATRTTTPASDRPTMPRLVRAARPSTDSHSNRTSGAVGR